MNPLPPERWQRVKDLFTAAMDLDSAQRQVFLEGATLIDPELRQEVESLLHHHDQADSFIALSIADLQRVLPGTEPPEPGLGERIGPYRLLRTLGRGGMGTVYLAERADAQFEMQVAIKCIQKGMDSEFLRQRFRRERQILANLEHPNIARMLDGGTTAGGVPYLVMEHVDGLPVDAYCDANGLNIRNRLELFRTICAAVQFAHQNLVVHRDIKPGNILVTADGVPKLLDFGIAKLLDAGPPDATATGFGLMTPEFSSPEQVRREAITTASDVYSLGVLLYLLLTGRRPYRFATGSPSELLDLVCVQEPTRPSVTAHSRELAGDLDNIILKAMRKEPERRYASVEQFSEDIRRHLAGLPVKARQDTLGYRASKFIRRNRVGVASAAIAAAALLGGSAVALQQAHVARLERAKAERRFNDVRKLTESFLFEFHDAIQDVPGTLVARQLVVARAKEYLDRMAQEAENDRPLQSELAEAYTRLAHVAEDSHSVVEDHRKALAITQALALAEPANVAFQHDLANSHGELAGELRMIGDTAGALEHGQEAVRVMEHLMASGIQNDAWNFDLADLRIEAGNALEEAGDLQAAQALYRQALSLIMELAARNSGNLDYRQAKIVGLASMGNALDQQEESEAAVDLFQEALRLVEDAQKNAQGNTMLIRDASILHRRIGRALTHQGRPASALDHFRKSLGEIESLIKADPSDIGHRRVLASLRQDEGDAYVALGHRAAAFASYRSSLSISQEVASHDPARAETKGDIAAVLARIGSLESALGDAAKGDEALLKAGAMLRTLHQSNPMNALVARDLADACLRRAKVQVLLARRPPAAQQGKAWSLAAGSANECLDIFRRLKERKSSLPSDEDRIREARRIVALSRQASSRS